MSAWLLLFALPSSLFLVNAFVVIPPSAHHRLHDYAINTAKLHAAIDGETDSAVTLDSLSVDDSSKEFASPTAVRAPLKFMGPYPVLSLSFPDLQTPSQREKNISGIALDFVLDTGANTNTINGQVAQELQLPVVGEIPNAVGAGGAMASGGATYQLGDAQLENIPNSTDFTFMTNLSATALPVANPATAGLLSFAFMQPFDGIEFQWMPSVGSVAMGVSSFDGMNEATKSDDEENKVQHPPSVTFYEEVPKSVLDDKKCVTIQRVPLTELPTIEININGVCIPALLDTGSPITVLNAQAAKEAGIVTYEEDCKDKTESKSPLSSLNPFAGISKNIQQAQAAQRGEVLAIMGSAGKPVNLWKSKEQVLVMATSVDEDVDVDLGLNHVYVGDLPGLAALDKFSSASGSSTKKAPAIVLGMDILRQRPMLLQASKNQVWFGDSY